MKIVKKCVINIILIVAMITSVSKVNAENKEILVVGASLGSYLFEEKPGDFLEERDGWSLFSIENPDNNANVDRGLLAFIQKNLSVVMI